MTVARIYDVVEVLRGRATVWRALAADVCAMDAAALRLSLASRGCEEHADAVLAAARHAEHTREPVLFT